MTFLQPSDPGSTHNSIAFHPGDGMFMYRKHSGTPGQMQATQEIRYVDGTINFYEQYAIPWTTRRHWRITHSVDPYDNRTGYTCHQGSGKLLKVEHPDGIDTVYNYAPTWIGGVWPSSGSGTLYSGIEVSYVDRISGLPISGRTRRYLYKKRATVNHGAVTGVTEPLNGDLLYRTYFETGRYLDPLASPQSDTLFSIPASLDAPERHQVVEYSYVPGTGFLATISHFLSDGITTGIETAPIPAVSYTYISVGNRARVRTEVLHMQDNLTFTYDYTVHPGQVDQYGQSALQTTSRTTEDGADVIYEMDTLGRIISVKTLPRTGVGVADRASDPDYDPTHDQQPTRLETHYEYGSESCMCKGKPTAVVQLPSNRRTEYVYEQTSGLLKELREPNPSGGSAPAVTKFDWEPVVASQPHGRWRLKKRTDPNGEEWEWQYVDVDRQDASWGKKDWIVVTQSPEVTLSTSAPQVYSVSQVFNKEHPTFNVGGDQSVLVGQMTHRTDANGVTTEYGFDNYGRLDELTANPGGGNTEIKTAYLLDRWGDAITITENATSASPLTTSITRDGRGSPSRIAATVNGVTHERRMYYDAWGHTAIVLSSNKTSTGSAPDDFHPSQPRTDAAREWLREEWHYHGGRLLAHYVDRRPIDRDNAGAVADEADARFARVDYTWTPDNWLLQVGGSNGAVTEFIYDGFGSIFKITKSGGVSVLSFGKRFVNGALETTRTVDALGQVTCIERNAAGTVSRIVEPTGQVPANYPPGWLVPSAIREFTTDVIGRIVDERTYASPGGSQNLLLSERTTYDEIGRAWLVEVFEGSQTTASQTYTSLWEGATKVKRVTGPGGRYTERAFDALARVVEERDSRDPTNPNKVAFEFEPKTNFVKKSRSLDWDEMPGVGAYVTRETEYVRDNLGRVLQAKYFGSSSTPLVHSFTYYCSGQTESYTDPAGRVENYLPDAVGRLVERFRPHGTSIWNGTTFLDWTGTNSRSETEQVDGLGHVTRTIFDFAGRTAIVMEPGCVAEPTATSPNQPFAQMFQYDALSRLTDLYTGDDAHVAFLRDAGGRVLGRYMLGGNQHVSAFHAGDWVERNALGQITKTQSILGLGLGVYLDEQFQIDALGRTHRESFQYLFVPGWTDVESTYSPTALGDPIRRGVNYDNNLSGDVDDLWIDAVPDAVGRMQGLAWRTTPGGTSTPLAAYVHEGVAIRQRITNYPLGASVPAAFTTSYSYDDYGRMSRIDHLPITGASVDFHYDLSSNLVKEVYEKQGLAGTGEGDRFAYDEHNRLVKAWLGSDAQNLAAADPDAGPGSFVKRLTYGLDQGNNRSNVQTLSGGATTDATYAIQQDGQDQGPSNRYDIADGQKIWHDDRGNTIFDGRHYFVYDAFNRLTEVWEIAGSGQQMAMTGSGSAASSGVGTGGQASSPQAEGGAAQGASIALVPDVRYVVDDVTALRHARATVMGRVGANLLTVLASNHQAPIAAQLREPLIAGAAQVASAQQASSSSMQLSSGGGAASSMAPSPEELDLVLEALYLYDFSDRRVFRWLLADTMYYYAYDDWEEVQEIKLGVGAVKQFVWGEELDELVAFRTKNSNGSWNSYYVAEGGAHCPSRVIDSAGSVVEIQEYDPYGQTNFFTGAGSYVGTASGVGNPFGWKGHRIDPETGFVFMRHRYYSTAIGRFVSQDLIGSWGDVENYGNSYSYGANNPLVKSDEFGLQQRHHWVPRALFEEGRPNAKEFSKEVRGVFKQAASEPSSAHKGFKKPHDEYNEAVEKEMDKWLKDIGKTADKVTPEEAAEFAKKIEKGEGNKVIKRFNDAVRKGAQKRAEAKAKKLAARVAIGGLLKRGARGLVKKALAPVFFVWDCGEGGLDHAVHQATWPASEVLVGPSAHELEELEKELDNEVPFEIEDEGKVDGPRGNQNAGGMGVHILP